MPVASSRLLDSLANDVARLRVVAARDLTSPVPTCPEWVVDDLVRHVVNGLRNVALRRLLGETPTLEPDRDDPDPLSSLDRAHADFVAELTTRPLDELAQQPRENEFTPAETAYFWLRRMTHEIAVHRADAELAQHEAITAVADDLATDGITEMLDLFLQYESHEYPDRFAGALSDWGDRWLLVTAGDVRWRVTVTPTGIRAGIAADSDTSPAVTVAGDLTTVMMWLYNRDEGATISGDAALIAQARELFDRATI